MPITYSIVGPLRLTPNQRPEAQAGYVHKRMKKGRRLDVLCPAQSVAGSPTAGRRRGSSGGARGGVDAGGFAPGRFPAGRAMGRLILHNAKIGRPPVLRVVRVAPASEAMTTQATAAIRKATWTPKDTTFNHHPAATRKTVPTAEFHVKRP
jgi:hypothetical protein